MATTANGNDDPLTTQKRHVMRRLLQVFTIEELAVLAENAEVMKAIRWGKMTIIFADTHKKTVEVTSSQKLP